MNLPSPSIPLPEGEGSTTSPYSTERNTAPPSPPGEGMGMRKDFASHHHQIDKLVDRHRRKPLAIKADLAQRAPLFLGKYARDIGLEFLHQHRYTLLAALAVAERIIDLRQRGLGAVLEVHLDRGGIGALSGVVVFAFENLRFRELHFCAQRVDARVRGALVFVIVGGERAEYHADRHHVLHAMVAIGRIRERSGLVEYHH